MRWYLLAIVFAVAFLLPFKPMDPAGIIEIELTENMIKEIRPYEWGPNKSITSETRIFIVPNDSEHLYGLEIYYEFIAKKAAPLPGRKTYYSFLRNSVFSNPRNLSRNPEDYRNFLVRDQVALVVIENNEVVSSRNTIATQNHPLMSNPLIRWPLPYN